MAANAQHLSEKRPFKICNSSREGKKGIVCSSLEELKCISRENFELGAGCRVFLETDGTEVDSDEYFQFLPPQTLFMVTKSYEQWTKSAADAANTENKFSNESESQESYQGEDEIDSGPTALSSSLKARICEEPMFFVSSSTEELHYIIDIGLETLQHELNITSQRAQFLVDSCEQELSRRTDIKEVHELLNICYKAINSKWPAGTNV